LPSSSKVDDKLADTDAEEDSDQEWDYENNSGDINDWFN
jgi:hypothetical protein